MVTQIQMSAVIWISHLLTYSTYIQSIFNIKASNSQSFPKGVPFLCIKKSAIAHCLMFFSRLKTSHPLRTRHNTNHSGYQAAPDDRLKLEEETSFASGSHCLHDIPSWRHYFLNTPHTNTHSYIDIFTHITVIKEWLCSLRLVDMSQSSKSVVKVRDYYIRSTAKLTNLDTLPSWKMSYNLRVHLARNSSWALSTACVKSNGKGHPMTCLCRHRREAEVWHQSICNPAIGGGWTAPTLAA